MSKDYLLEHDIEDYCSMFSLHYEIEDDGTDNVLLSSSTVIFLLNEEILLESSENSFDLTIFTSIIVKYNKSTAQLINMTVVNFRSPL